jgi:dTDP-4-dehydrorhamnose 3,5-epimerase
MRFTETRIPGAFVIDPERIEDERGFFARTWCEETFRARGLRTRLVQCSLSCNRKKGTLRGMHWQAPPHPEAKLVRCTRGAIHDVILDLRPESPAYKRWEAVILTADNGRMLYVPEGVAHGFQTLADDTEVFYQMSEAHHPECARGVRWDDPAFGIAWPPGERILNDRDRRYEDFGT